MTLKDTKNKTKQVCKDNMQEKKYGLSIGEDDRWVGNLLAEPLKARIIYSKDI